MNIRIFKDNKANLKKSNMFDRCCIFYDEEISSTFFCLLKWFLILKKEIRGIDLEDECVCV